MSSTNLDHTPGPWKYRYEGSGDYEVYSEAGGEIGTAWSKDAHFLGLGKESAQNEANARLICAAPDLLRVCQWLFAAMNDKLGRDLVSIPLGIEEDMRAAIFKATEQEP